MSRDGAELDRYGLRRRDRSDDPTLFTRLAQSSRALRLLVATTFRADLRDAVGSTVLEVFGGVAYAVSALWLKVLADAVVRRDAHSATAAALGMAAFQGVNWLGQAFGTRMRITLMERVGFAFDAQIATLTSALPGLEHTERPDYQDRLILLREAQGLLGGGANALVNLANALLRGVSAVVVLTTIHPLLILLPVFAIPQLIAQAAAQRWARRGDDESAPHRRRALHLYGLGLHEPAGRELRIFGLENEVSARLAVAWRAGAAPLVQARIRAAIANAAASAIFATGFVGAVVLVVRRAATGRATPGDALLTMALAGQVSQYVGAVVGSIANLQRMLRETARLVWLIDYSHDEWARHVGVSEPGAALSSGITLEGVSFRYPGTDRWILRDLDLHLPAGCVIALVGENGAGKTTLVKLLCRFYDPSEGSIRIDGVEMRELGVDRWRARLAAGFQDFCRFELIARDTVGLGDLGRLDDDQAVRSALARAGASEVAAVLPSGLNTQLGARWEGGVDLSGGQWQKLALGRTLMRDVPLVLVLDEPTASLDAPTEHELFERLATASRAHPANRVTVIVSHRFSTVRMADHIVVIAGGGILEQGGHDELMAHGGLYADLYDLQARAYE